MPGQSQGGGKPRWESPLPLVPGDAQAGGASTPAGMPSGYCSLWEAQTGHIRTKTSVLKGLLKVKPVRTEGQSLFKKHRPVYLLQLRPPRGLSIWQGGLFRNSYGRAVPRLEGRRGGRRGGLRKQRGRKDKGAARRNGGEAGMRGHRKGGLFFFFFIVLLSPGHTEGKQRTAIKGL